MNDPLQPPAGPSTQDRSSTGVPGLDDILGGGLTTHRLYLVEGTPGTGKTTLALQFLLEGARQGEKGLYVTLSETPTELRSVAATHGWSLDKIELFELVNDAGLDPDSEQSILHPSEIELGETTKAVIRQIDTLAPSRIVFDSLSEMRLLAQDPLRYRRQILALKHFFSTRRCTVLMLDDKTSEPGDQQLHSIAHGVISLDQKAEEFGAERRKLRVVKMRGIKFIGGFHDFVLATGGIRVFPRLVAAGQHREFSAVARSTGVPGLDRILGGGLVPGTNTLLMGPSGVGKTTTAMRCLLAALERGERAVYFLFDEGMATFLTRGIALGMDLRPYIENGLLKVHQIDPAERSPGEFASLIHEAVGQDRVNIVAIDSLNAYLQAMPGERFLLLQMHELLTYLNQQGVTTLLVLGQHGLVGEIRSDVDLSYLSDSILAFRFFEAKGKILTAISTIKSRTSNHERTIREFRLTANGLEIGEPLQNFEGILTGLPTYHGATGMLGSDG
ncbi:MAG TPA: ATPase domain-containing protein [Noviherbaspirillum sp.]|jgi:circadian clock protein KaiC|uniref:ATPase domain-containing protein n=1 Tax=Noviherbaspirillum sp. TaxID=1926288 RepID=UPI002DDCF782|nr:ATPase domain-containing protein [Noviherbaspirillum sp.]HEV2609159.1 ATPase domain-containing protein [Noviherbaspirillum sp.]